LTGVLGFNPLSSERRHDCVISKRRPTTRHHGTGERQRSRMTVPPGERATQIRSASPVDVRTSQVPQKP
jgi:hypothetical protein